MGQLNPALLAEMQKRRFTLFGAVEIVLPERTVRLLDGAGEVMIGGERYLGRDPEWGVLAYVKGLSDSDGDSSPAPVLGLVPSGELALSQMLNPALQGSPVSVMIGALDRQTGSPIGEMYVPFTGELDVATPSWDLNRREVEFALSGVGERLFQVEEGRRLSDSFHQTVWPGELGLAFVTDVESTVNWGQSTSSTAGGTRGVFERPLNQEVSR
ncbi:hypothetical protein [Qipengyuania sp.]|uniref:hypothetical protein n=1 Tax=Qipengyuania sp. TaxID=2004515 RepID=UPI0035C82A2C